MTGPHASLRRLVLVLAAFATFAMHTGLTGACTDPAASAHVVTASAAMAQTGSTGYPAMPHDSGPRTHQLCQVRLPSATASAPGAETALALTGSMITPSTLGALPPSAAPRRPPPPEQSSLCVWRI